MPPSDTSPGRRNTRAVSRVRPVTWSQHAAEPRRQPASRHANRGQPAGSALALRWGDGSPRQKTHARRPMG